VIDHADKTRACRLRPDLVQLVHGSSPEEASDYDVVGLLTLLHQRQTVWTAIDGSRICADINASDPIVAALIQLSKRCLNYQADQRPNFKELVLALSDVDIVQRTAAFESAL
jgi:hypothetical protein